MTAIVLYGAMVGCVLVLLGAFGWWTLRVATRTPVPTASDIVKEPQKDARTDGLSRRGALR